MNHAPTDFNALLPKTADVLRQLATFSLLSEFTFVGGSALALYLNHRKSEDIDLFTWHDQLDKTLIFQTLWQTGRDVKLVNDTAQQQDWLIDAVKVTFFANNWLALRDNRRHVEAYLSVATLELLCAMKVNTLFLRAKYRDYYDLYAISKSGFSIETMYDYAFSFVPNINKKLFQMSLTYTDDIQDDAIIYLEPKYKIKKIAIAKYFDKAIEKWLANSLK